MNKKITRILAALALLTFLAVPMGMWGQTNTASFAPADFDGQGTSGTGSSISATNNGVTFACDKGYGTTQIRCYSGSIITISSSNTITAISFTFSGSYTGGMETSYTNLSTTSWTKTLTSQARITACSVSYTGGDTPQPTTYTVTYDANGGSGTMTDSDSPYAAGATVTVLGNEFTRTDYEFDHWNTAADDSGTSYDEDDTFTINANTTLYAQWTENTTPTPGGITAILNIAAYAEANNWDNGTKYTTATVAPVTFTANGGGNTGKYYTSGQDWRFYQNESASITITVAEGYTLVSVTPTYSVSNSGVLKNGNTTIASGTTVNVSGTSVTFTVGNSGSATNGQVKFTNIDVTYVSNGGTIPPSITANNVEIAYDATSGSFEFTVNNPVEGGVTTVTEDVDWISDAIVSGNTVNFSTSANEASTARTATITLTYTYGDNESVTKDVTITQAGNPNVTMTITEVRAQGTGDVVTTGIVTSCVGTTGYIQDASAAICLYGTSLTVGNEIRVSGTLSTYHGLLEITNPVVTVISQDNTVNPEVMTIAEVVANTNQGWYVRIEDATVTEINGQNTTIAQGGNTIVVRGISGVEYDVNDVLSLNGNIGCYDGNQIANPQNVEVQAAPAVPYTLTVEPFENLELITFVNDEMVMEGDGEIQVNEGNQIMLSIVAAEGYVMQTLMVNGVNHVNDIADDFTYTFEMPAENVTISATAVEDVPPTLGDKYVKVTSTADLTSGQYLIVYAEGSVAFDGSLETLDAASNTIEVTINDNEIGITNITTASEFTIDVTAGTIMSASGYYIGQTSDANGLASSNTTAYTNTISFDEDGNANIVSGGAYLRYNSASNQNRFRYYKSSSYTAQKAIQLYKKVGDEPATETHTLTINGYGSSTTGGWYLIASPVAVNPANVEGMTIENPEDPNYSDFDLYYFDQTGGQNGKEWKNYKAKHFNLVPGTGYLYANKGNVNNNPNTVTLTFEGVPYSGNGVVDLVYSEDNEDANMHGWNLIGNPFSTAATLNMPFFKMNGTGSGFTSQNANSSVAAMEGVLVYAYDDVALQPISTATFTAAGRSNSESAAMVNIDVVSSFGDVMDNAIVNFNEGIQLPKFYFGTQNANIYIPQGNKEYAIVNTEAQGEMPVNFKAAENGTYTLTVNPEGVEMNYLHLIDNKTGADIDLLQTPNYTFDSRTTDYTSRFRLVFGANGASAGSASDETFAYFNGSEWMINNSGNATLQVVDVMGRVLSSEAVNGSVSKAINTTAGVYMLRLVSGNDVKTQKIVVR